MLAVALDLDVLFVLSVVTVGATIFFVFSDGALAHRVGAFLGVSHGGYPFLSNFDFYDVRRLYGTSDLFFRVTQNSAALCPGLDLAAPTALDSCDANNAATERLLALRPESSPHLRTFKLRENATSTRS